MPLVTMSGQHGSGASEIAHMVAEWLGASYLDQELLRQVADRLGSTPEALRSRDERLDSVGQRIAASMRRLFETQAQGGVVGDVYLDTVGLPMMLARSYE